MRSNWNSLPLCGAVLALSLLSGCGEPNIEAMKPTTPKLTSGIFVVDHPIGWSSAGISTVMANTGVNTEEVSVSSANVLAKVSQMITSNNLALCVLVDDFPSLSLIHSLAANNPQVKFEWVMSAPTSNNDANVRQVVPDNSISAYATGWVAGQTAVNGNIPVVGVLADAPTVSKIQIEQVLAAASTANQNLTLVPVSLTTFAPTASNLNGVGGMANSTSGTNTQSTYQNANITTSSSMQGTLTLPRILIVTRVLSNSERQLIANAGTTIYSLVPMTANGTLASQPELVPMAAIQSDIDAFSRGTWKPGIVQYYVNPPINLTSMLIPQTIRSTFTSIVKELGQNPNLGQQQYTMESAEKKLSWAPILQNAE